MANSPLKNKNALGNNMAQDNKSKGAASAGSGSMFGQGYVPGGKQAPYWQTQDMGAGIPQGKPAWMTQGNKQYNISSDGGDYYAEGGGADQAIAGDTTGTVTPAPAPGKYTLPDGSTTDSEYEYQLAWQAYNAPNSGKAEDILAGNAGGIDSTTTYKPSGVDPAGTWTTGTDSLSDSEARLQDLYNQYLGGVGTTDWEQQKNSAIAQMQAQAGQQRLALQNAMAAAGGTSSSGASGAYMGGMGQLGFNQQMAQGAVLSDLQKGKAAEDLARLQGMSALAGQMSENDFQKLLMEETMKQNTFDRKLTIIDAYAAWLQSMNMEPGNDPYFEQLIQENLGMSIGEYLNMTQG